MRINFTLLTSVLLQINSNSGPFAQLGDLQRAIYAVTAEASMGRTGDDPSPAGMLPAIPVCEHGGDYYEAYPTARLKAALALGLETVNVEIVPCINPNHPEETAP